ncbi:Acylphosphatase-1 [Sparganum proliferum]
MTISSGASEQPFFNAVVWLSSSKSLEEYKVIAKLCNRSAGVFFRKYTAMTARENNIVGWVKNTSTGTVVGVAEGPDSKMDVL